MRCLVAGAERLDFCDGTARLLGASRIVVHDLEETWPEEAETQTWGTVRKSSASLTTLVLRAGHWHTWSRALHAHPADMARLALRRGDQLLRRPRREATLVSVSRQSDPGEQLGYLTLGSAILDAASGAVTTAQPAADICACDVPGRLRECASGSFGLLARALARQQGGQTSGTVWRMCAHDASLTVKAQRTS